MTKGKERESLNWIYHISWHATVSTVKSAGYKMVKKLRNQKLGMFFHCF